MATYHAIFLRPLPKGEYCLDTMAEELGDQLEEVEHYDEIFDYDNKDGELCFRASFSFEVGEDVIMPSGTHAYNCQADCRYCGELENAQEACEREEEEITDEITDQIDSIEGFDRLELI